MTHIALVEDDPTLASNYADIFARENWEVTVFGSREDASREIPNLKIDIAVVDIGLGAETNGGFLLCKELRMLPETETLPIIFLTARTAEIDRIQGLQFGADEYIPKNESIDLIVMRIKALLRRIEFEHAPKETKQETIPIGSLVLYPGPSKATWKGQPVAITVSEYDVVEKLARHPGMVYAHDQLTYKSAYVERNTTVSNIRRLRKKFEEVDPEFQSIVTEIGRGYSWKKV